MAVGFVAWAAKEAASAAIGITKSFLKKRAEKKSGKEMASSIMKRDPNQGAIQKIEGKKKIDPVSPLVNIKSLKPQSKEQSKKSSGVESIDSALD